ncbi:Cytosolic sulfotransferase 5 [Acorus gramineus]|uniref:Sulfotransferase n=1 Tax=Acorus gramineus TaxID=55184 RepID=A0AAV9BB21_ACOGR|nr:Cytosolic sulfotransferase 5 [Acorus gramineus]
MASPQRPSVSSKEPTDDQESYNRYKDLISTLPTQRWVGDDLCQYHGFWFLRIALEGLMAARDRFVARSTDVILVTFPKSGTTWLKALTFATINRNRADVAEPNHPLSMLSKLNPHECVPFISFLYNDGRLPDLDSLHEPRLFAEHVPFSLLPESVLGSGCRIVYLCRDPKDNLVSLWHYMLARAHARGLAQYHSFDEVFELFCSGISMGGPMWDHVLDYWRESLRRPERVMFMKYEQLKGDTGGCLKRLAEFIGCPFSEEEEREGKVEEIVEMCSFERLSELEVNKNGRRGIGSREIENKEFFRKGVVGDWKRHLTAEMAEQLDRITEEKFRGSGLKFDKAPLENW